MKKFIFKKSPLGKDSAFVVYCLFLKHRQKFDVHCHDHPELFLVDIGSGIHLVNGERNRLNPGDLYLMRPDDQHGFVADSEQGLQYINVSFAASTLRYIHKRYFKRQSRFWGGNHKMPWHKTLAEQPMRHLRDNIAALSRSDKTQIEIDRFLLNVLQEYCYPSSIFKAEGFCRLPAWLQKACEDMKKPENFCKSAKQFSVLSSKTAEHIARLLKKHTGKTPSNILNESRMAHAAHLLATTHKEILEIAYECGYSSIGYFYGIFAKRFGLSPRRFRLQHQGLG